MTPQYAIQSIERGITDSVGKDQYITLADGEAGLKYITKDFWLGGTFDKFNGRFEIKWQWTPDQKQIADGVEEELDKLPNKDAYMNAVVIDHDTGNSNEQ